MWEFLCRGLITLPQVYFAVVVAMLCGVVADRLGYPDLAGNAAIIGLAAGLGIAIVFTVVRYRRRTEDDPRWPRAESRDNPFRR